MDDEHGGLQASPTPLRYDPMAALAELEEKGGDREQLFEQKRWQAATQFVFEDLKFSVGKKEILRGISGYANPGQVLAIMGPSGAGKTSLLDMLAGRVAHSTQKLSFSGAVKINGEKRNFALFRKMSAFVQQSDMLFPELTVRETITFSAILRLPGDMPRETKMQRVDQVMTFILHRCSSLCIICSTFQYISNDAAVFQPMF